MAKILRILFMIGVPLKGPSQRFFSNAKKRKFNRGWCLLITYNTRDHLDPAGIEPGSLASLPSVYPFRRGLSSQSCEDKRLLGLKLLYSNAGTEPYRLRDANVGQISSGAFKDAFLSGRVTEWPFRGIATDIIFHTLF